MADLNNPAVDNNILNVSPALFFVNPSTPSIKYAVGSTDDRGYFDVKGFAFAR